jgi:hypothetical protein
VHEIHVLNRFKKGEFMNLEFKVYQLKDGSKYAKMVNEKEFIVVGEEGNYYKACGVTDGRIAVLADIKLDEFAYMFPKEDLELQKDDISTVYYEFDIPKKNLTIDIIENIKKLNE